MCLLFFTPLFLRLVPAAAVGGLRPVEFPFQIPEAEQETEQAGSHYGWAGKPVSTVFPAARRMGARSSHI